MTQGKKNGENYLRARACIARVTRNSPMNLFFTFFDTKFVLLVFVMFFVCFCVFIHVLLFSCKFC